MERWQKIGLLFTGWLIVASYSAIAIAGEGIPETLTTRHPNIDKTYPTWVSAAAATQADGSLDSGLFHPVLLDDLQRALATPADPIKGCSHTKCQPLVRGPLVRGGSDKLPLD